VPIVSLWLPNAFGALVAIDYHGGRIPDDRATTMFELPSYRIVRNIVKHTDTTRRSDSHRKVTGAKKPLSIRPRERTESGLKDALKEFSA
jgi:hypothetical protein